MDTIKAIVQKVIREGRHGPFAVATSNQIGGSVTFSLEPTVWREGDWPERGMVVILGKLRQKRAGWRAKEGRFCKPSDEQNQQPERSKQMQFLYPISRQFSVDEACEQIVRELEHRNFKVPGIEVEFDHHGSGEQKFCRVYRVEGRDFRLRFSRRQGALPGNRWSDSAAISEINIPKKELHIYDDESGPTLYLYVGNDWERDRDQFMNGSKVNSKLSRKPRTYLEYKGGCDCHHTRGASFEAIGLLTALIDGDRQKLADLRHTHRDERSPLLVHNNDLGREYDPEGDEPTLFRTEEVLLEFKEYLTETVLKMITSQPIPVEKIDHFTSPEPIPFSGSIGALFCFAEYSDVARILQGQKDPTGLIAADRYALTGGGYRLVNLGTPNDGTVPEVAYEGFKWCGIGEVTADTPIKSLNIPGHYRYSDSEKFLIRIVPKKANEIFIADHSAWEKRRQVFVDLAQSEGRARLTDHECCDFMRARGRTLVPIHEYSGGYEQPVVLINRELSFDEVEVVSGGRYLEEIKNEQLV